MNNNNISSTISDLNNEMQFLQSRIPLENDVKIVKKMIRHKKAIFTATNMLTEIKLLAVEIRQNL